MTLFRYVLVRLGFGVLTLIGISLVVFLVMRSSGDPVDLSLPVSASAEQRAAVRHDLGLDDPLVLQYLDFATSAAHGDLGNSIGYHLPVWDLISDGLWASVKLAFASVALAMVTGVALGVASAARPGGVADRLARLVSLLGMSMPTFWLGIVLILIFNTWVTWFPAAGDEGWKSLVLPAVTLALFPMAGWTKITRSAMTEVLNSDFIRLERLAGFRDRRITWKYALKNVLVPAMSFLGLVLGPTVGGAVVVETIFAWPGIGRLAVNAITQRDYPIIQGITLVITVIVVLVNIVVDIAYGIIDPRLSRG
ncbi:MAG TPA: ABC transporter permease [Ilumatobacteraceae bacterium]